LLQTPLEKALHTTSLGIGPPEKKIRKGGKEREMKDREEQKGKEGVMGKLAASTQEGQTALVMSRDPVSLLFIEICLLLTIR